MSKVEENKKRKKTALLDTAYHLFTQNGYQKTSISDIVSQAGVAKGTFYLYFKDKTDIRYKLIAHRAGLIFKRLTGIWNELISGCLKTKSCFWQTILLISCTGIPHS